MELRALLLPPMFLVRAGVPPLGPTSAEISGSSAEKARIPPAMARSATCGAIGLNPKSNGSIQKAACLDSVRAWGSRVSLLSRSVRALRGSHNLSERATSWWPMLSVGVYPDRFGESVGGHSLCFLLDRKSTRLNSSHQIISYAVFCLKKKNDRSSRSDPSSRPRPTPPDD